MDVLVAVNNYTHDFSSALWIATLVMGFLLRKSHAKGRCECAVSHYRGLTRLFWWSFAATLFFGVFRAIAYQKYEWVEGMGDSQITFLIIKHVIFTVVVVFGILHWRSIGRAITAGKESTVEA
jgi:hypothetical protein